MKICKPRNSQTRGFKTCEKERYIYKFGICSVCFYDWLSDDERGKIYKQKIFNKKVEQKIKQKRKQKSRELNSSKTMSNADTYFSRYIRLKHSKNGKCTCYTCGTIKEIKEVDNGHYQKRGNQGTRYHEDNCRPQCKTCNGNTAKNGMQDVYRVNLSNEIGEEKVIEIEKLARSIQNTNHIYFQEISDYYREKLNELQKELKVKYW